MNIWAFFNLHTQKKSMRNILILTYLFLIWALFIIPFRFVIYNLINWVLSTYAHGTADRLNCVASAATAAAAAAAATTDGPKIWLRWWGACAITTAETCYRISNVYDVHIHRCLRMRVRCLFSDASIEFPYAQRRRNSYGIIKCVRSALYIVDSNWFRVKQK